MKTITFKTDKSGISIRIPKTLISHVAKHNPDDPIKVRKSLEFMNEVAELLEGDLGSEDDSNALTGFQELLDKAIYTAVENGSEYAEFKSDEDY